MLQSELAILGPLAAGLASAFMAGKPARSHPFATLSMAALIVLGFAAQSAFPHLLSALERDPAILQGQIWRLVTALFFQDGGIFGFVFNLSFLLALGVLAEQHFSRAHWLAIYFLGALAAEAVGLAWRPIGAGNSVAFFALAGALTIHAINWKQWLRLGVLAIGFGAGAALLATHDIHGVAYFAGAVIAASYERAWTKAGLVRG